MSEGRNNIKLNGYEPLGIIYEESSDVSEAAIKQILSTLPRGAKFICKKRFGAKWADNIIEKIDNDAY